MTFALLSAQQLALLQRQRERAPPDAWEEEEAPPEAAPLLQATPWRLRWHAFRLVSHAGRNVGRFLWTHVRASALRVRRVADWAVARARGVAAYAPLACESSHASDEEEPSVATSPPLAPAAAPAPRFHSATEADIREKNRALTATQERRLFG
jgi:hypothetical protein